MSDIEHAPPRTHAEFERHARTYHAFTLLVKWASIVLAATIVFLAMWFATGAGFLAAFVVGALVFAAGAWAMSHGLAHSSERE